MRVTLKVREERGYLAKLLRVIFLFAAVSARLAGFTDSSFALRPRASLDREALKSGYTNDESLYHRGVRGVQVVIFPKSNAPQKNFDAMRGTSFVPYAKETELYSIVVYPSRNIVCFSHLFYSKVESLLDENYPNLSNEPSLEFYFVYRAAKSTYAAQLRGNISTNDPGQLRHLLESLRMLTDIDIDFELRRISFDGGLPLGADTPFVTKEVLEARLDTLLAPVTKPAPATKKLGRRPKAVSRGVSSQI